MEYDHHAAAEPSSVRRQHDRKVRTVIGSVFRIEAYPGVLGSNLVSERLLNKYLESIGFRRVRVRVQSVVRSARDLYLHEQAWGLI